MVYNVFRIRVTGESVIGKSHQICDMHSALYRDTTLWISVKYL